MAAQMELMQNCASERDTDLNAVGNAPTLDKIVAERLKAKTISGKPTQTTGRR